MTTALAAGSAALRERLADVVAAALDVPRERVGLQTPFSALGMDSLGAAELTLAVEEAFGFALDASAPFEHPDVESLARCLEAHEAGAPRSRPSVPARPGVPDAPLELSLELPRERERRLGRLAAMRADAVLPPEIAPRGATDRGARAAAAASRPLLTGATGFVGAHVLQALLRQPGTVVHCLVRARSLAEGLARVRGNLQRHGLWEPAYAARLRIVPGDLAQPRLGLSPSRFASLAEAIDVVFHGAASVNWVQPYEALRDANVLGTREMLRLACHGAPKPVHFVSTLSVCYSTLGPRRVTEADDALPRLAGLHLGYAQSKCVAEALVRQAGARGLPVTIVRPALVAGHGVSGRSNPEDLLSAFVAGCVRMGAAPDLDWRLDAVPVDDVASAIVALGRTHARGTRVVHLVNARPRHWRECVLWMRLYGHALRLVPYGEWATLLRAATTQPGHPLRALAPFFLRRVGEAGGAALPELYEESRRAHAATTRSDRLLGALRVPRTPLDGHLLQGYFAAWEDDGLLPRPAYRSARPARRRAGRPVPELGRLLPRIQAALRQRHDDARLRVVGVEVVPLGASDSIVAELTSWRQGSASGLFRASLTLRGGRGETSRVECVVKAKAEDRQVVEVAETVARLCSPALGEAYARFHGDVGFTRCQQREPALYASDEPVLRAHTPACLATLSDEAWGEWLVAIEDLSDAVLLNAADDPSRWRPEHVAAAVRGIAAVHGAWTGRVERLRAAPWLAPERTPGRVIAMEPLWSALAAHARPAFAAWAGTSMATIHARLVGDTAGWAAALGAQPRTLIHNDFNPRNIAIRRAPPAPDGRPDGLRLCAYDWELATIGAPQRDLAELLCFVLSPATTRAEVARWLDAHREALAAATGRAVDADAWEHGFRAALCELLVDRLSMYAMVHRVRAQRFLPRVVRTWLALHRLFPWP